MRTKSYTKSKNVDSNVIIHIVCIIEHKRIATPAGGGPDTQPGSDSCKAHQAATPAIFRSSAIIFTYCSKHTSASWGPGDASG